MGGGGGGAEGGGSVRRTARSHVFSLPAHLYSVGLGVPRIHGWAEGHREQVAAGPGDEVEVVVVHDVGRVEDARGRGRNRPVELDARLRPLYALRVNGGQLAWERAESPPRLSRGRSGWRLIRVVEGEHSAAGERGRGGDTVRTNGGITSGAGVWKTNLGPRADDGESVSCFWLNSATLSAVLNSSLKPPVLLFSSTPVVRLWCESSRSMAERFAMNRSEVGVRGPLGEPREPECGVLLPECGVRGEL